LTRIRLVPIIFIVVVTLAALIGGWQAYQHFDLLNPLQSRLTQIQGVQSAHVDTGSNSVTIQLTPVAKLQNQDLQTTYNEILAVTENTLGANASIKLLDHRGWPLISAYESYYPSLTEGLSKGNYVEMVSNIEQKATADHLEARITMDRHNIYIQFSKGNNYLYDVISYSLHQGGGAAS
jgi:hypothetical protein